MSGERSEWQGVADLMQEKLGDRRVRLGRDVSLPRLSHYKFAAKLIGSGKRVLDVGCGEGLGTWVLAVECGFARGVDEDREAIEVASSNWELDDRIEFASEDLLASTADGFHAVVAFDVAEPHAEGSLGRLSGSLPHDGIAMVGTPWSEGGAKRLEESMHARFGHVFMFGASEEVVHTATRSADYLLAVGCKPRSSSTETAS
jgi:2-polyprenyl-3-methyl-5-hydroxy-6-metoxy-1,4-benzoquinol methylase